MGLSTVKHEWRLDTEHGRIHAPFCYFFWVDLEKEGPIFFSIVYPMLTPSPMDSTNPKAIQMILIKLNISKNKPKVMNLGKRLVERRADN